MEMSHRVNVDRINQIALALVLLVSYVYTFPRWADQSMNSRLDSIVAVVDDGTFQIDRFVQNTVDYAKIGDHYYSDKPPGIAFLGIPVYAVLKQILRAPVVDGLVSRLSSNPAFASTLNPDGTGISPEKVRFALAYVVLSLLLGLIPTVVLALLMYRLLRKLHIKPTASALAVLGYGLLTPVFAYANTFYNHQLSAALLFAAFYLAFDREKLGQTSRLLAIGFLLAYSVINEYPVALISGILFLYTVYQLNQSGKVLKVIWCLATGLLVAGGWMAYNAAIFGGPFKIGYEYSADWIVQHHTGFMSLTFPHPSAMWGITFGAFRGLFFLSPLLLLAVPGMIVWWRRRVNRPEWLLSLAIVLVMYIFNASSIMWWGGFAIGPRYMLAAFPFITAGMAYAMDEWGKKTWFEILSGVMAFWSLVATWGLSLAGQSFPSDTIQNPLIQYALPNWLIGNIARNLGTILHLPSISSLFPLGALLIVMGLAWWVALIRKTGSSSLIVKPGDQPLENVG